VAELRASAVVAFKTEGFEGWVICCAYCTSPDAKLPLLELRRRVAELVPGYMVPARWMKFDVLPTNDNGKIDRSRLREQFASAETRRAKPGRQAMAPTVPESAATTAFE
jgi:acyl-coenzyme A synthetase/AMP-(fatty) acid ligase